MGIKFRDKGRFEKTTRFLTRNQNMDPRRIMAKYGKLGVERLSVATPKDTGETAASWTYDIVRTEEGWQLVFNNSKVTRDGVPVAVLLQYGHGLKNGSYVRGIDFINPALKPIFEKMAEDLWNEVNED
jgi:hypothetical protein